MNDDAISWRCCQLLSRDFIVYKVKLIVRASENISVAIFSIINCLINMFIVISVLRLEYLNLR